MLGPDARPPLPAALVCRGIGRLLCRASRRIRGHATLQEVRRIGNKGGASAIMFADSRLQPRRCARCRDIFSRYTDRTGSRMILKARTYWMNRRHFLVPTTQSKSCEKRAATRMIYL